MRDSVLGINLDGTTLHLGKVRDQRLVTRYFHRIPARSDEQSVLNQVFESIDKGMDASIAGIGFGVPSVVDLEHGIVYSVPNIPSWREIHLKEILEDKYEVPVYVNNDANAFAVGSYYFGEGQGHKDMIGLIIGTGLGLGLIFDGRLCCGSNCGAGEIGRLPYKDGEFEDYCSRKFFDDRASMQELLLRSRAERGEKQAVDLYDEFGEHMGQLLKVLLYSYDPELVVIGGSLYESFPLFEKKMLATLRSFRYGRSVDRLQIKATLNKTDSLILGAAALYLDSVNRLESANGK